MTPLLEFDRVSKWFRDTVAIGDVSFAVEAGVARSRLPLPEQRPAPRLGEDSRGVVADWLGIGEEEIAALEAAGTIENVRRTA